MSAGRFAERRFIRQRVASREQPSRGRGRGQIVAGLVGCEAGFSLWLRKAVRVASVGKAVVKWALTWSAKGQAAG